MDTVAVEKYNGPAVREGATHRITVSPTEHHWQPSLPFMRKGTGFRYESGPHLEIVAAFRECREYTGGAVRLTHQVHHVYLAREVRF